MMPAVSAMIRYTTADAGGIYDSYTWQSIRFVPYVQSLVKPNRPAWWTTSNPSTVVASPGTATTSKVCVTTTTLRSQDASATIPGAGSKIFERSSVHLSLNHLFTRAKWVEKRESGLNTKGK